FVLVLYLSLFFILIDLFSPVSFFSFTAPPPTLLYTLSLHDALPISFGQGLEGRIDLHWADGAVTLQPFTVTGSAGWTASLTKPRSEEHTSELQSRFDLVCRLLLEKKNT